MFNHLKTNEAEKNILKVFFERRNYFNIYISKNKLKLQTCPGCGYPTISQRGEWEICSVCNWEDDNQDDENAHEVWGGPNANLSLTENRIIIGKILSDDQNKDLNFDENYAEKVLKIILDFEQMQRAIEKKMTGEENLQHPMWQEWKQVEKKLQNAINEVNKS